MLTDWLTPRMVDSAFSLDRGDWEPVEEEGWEWEEGGRVEGGRGPGDRKATLTDSLADFPERNS